ncbi:MAG: YqaJ viral recombinase family protein [Bacteroidales bacterium]|nr:YqaJ viral recombinase family protein [Candidatus Egerieousia equi]
MGNYTIHAKNHQEWLEAREGGIGSSDVATLLGVNPWQTPYQLWLVKTGRVLNVEKESFLMKAGHYLEDAISHFCADETGLEIIKSSAEEFIVVDKDKPYLRVSPDRYAWMPELPHTKNNKVIIECKSTQNYIDEDDIPKYWFSQVQYQMGVCGIDKAVVAWLTQGRQFNYKWLEFDSEFYHDVIVAEIDRFWNENVLGDKEPELTDINDVLAKYPRQQDGMRAVATDEIVSVWNELKETNAEIKRLQALKEAAESRIKVAMGEAESLCTQATAESPSRLLATWKAGKSSERFNEALFKEQNPEVWAQYLRTTESTRRFMLK